MPALSTASLIFQDSYKIGGSPDGLSCKITIGKVGLQMLQNFLDYCRAKDLAAQRAGQAVISLLAVFSPKNSLEQY